MFELLLEIFCEEIPSGLQARAANDLQRLVCDGLKAAGIEFGEVSNYAGARRLTLVIEGLPDKSPDVSDERKGPRVGSPDKAVEGFLRAAGFASVDDAEIVSDEKKGDYYVARIEKQGRATGDVIAELVPAVIRQFPWPKSQRWGAGKLRWVRPMHSIICLLGGSVVPFELDGIASSDKTLGHRFLSEGAITVSDFADYENKLRDAHVILKAEERQKLILDGAQAAAKKASLELVEDDALLTEAAGLVEWPVVLMGEFDEEFLDVPPEVIITAIKKHQKCFSLRDGKTGKLANKFILISNLIAEDGGKAIIAGNERVVRARLSDAKFFWDQDRKVKLEDRLPALKDIIFHENLGTQAERVERIRILAGYLIGEMLTGVSGQSAEEAHRILNDTKVAAKLCKSDLVTDMVGEFPDLQGLMGRYYALDQGEDPSVAAAIEAHYRPQGPNDAVPADPVAIAVALADKLDTLVGFWAIDEKPTGSKDPYALRRAALGVIRTILDNKLRVQLSAAFEVIAEVVGDHLRDATLDNQFRAAAELEETLGGDSIVDRVIETDMARPSQNFGRSDKKTHEVLVNLLAFFHDRLKVYLRDRGARHDLLDAVLASERLDDLHAAAQRVEALEEMLSTPDGQTIREGVKRATNILRIEEKKDGTKYRSNPEEALIAQDEEKNLLKALNQARSGSKAAIASGKYVEALMQFIIIAPHIDAFFDHVTVNADDPNIRENRLKLLNQIREATLAVADFSMIEG